MYNGIKEAIKKIESPYLWVGLYSTLNRKLVNFSVFPLDSLHPSAYMLTLNLLFKNKSVIQYFSFLSKKEI